ncbi:MAG TPA: acetyl-CoA hydrolase/transferase C-terminal domain-containing protein [Holophagaceae bacterium]
MTRHASPSDAVACIQSAQRVFIHGGVATPTLLVEALVAQADRLRDVELIHIHVSGKVDYAKPEFARSFRVANLFVGPSMRPYVGSPRVDYLPCFLSEIPNLFRSGRRPLDVALLQLSPPDAHGFCTLGTSVDVARAAADSASILVAQINPQMPRVHGDGFIHLSRVHHWIEADMPIPEAPQPAIGPEEAAIGRYAAQIIEDGATLQMGIGGVPDAVLAALANHRHLGIHTEMMSDGVLGLVRSGVVDNTQKKIHPGKIVVGFVTGTRNLYDFIDDNPLVAMLDIAYINNPTIIARNPKVTAINSAVEIDLTGQVCADSVGHRIISGVGGQMDFIRGASLSPGGKPIIALTSRTKKGESRIVPTLKPGSGVVTTRQHVHWVITEYGLADLYGKTLHERARALIDIAHPDDREALARAWCDMATCE